MSDLPYFFYNNGLYRFFMRIEARFYQSVSKC